MLDDASFLDMTIEGWRATLAPKVIGSSLLDELYREANLDFFILMGSISGCIGNMSQAAYAAANGFMAGLVKQRRLRHQVASIVHPAQIRGLGYLERTDSRLLEFLNDTMSGFAITEPDLHELIAEAILAGHPDAGQEPEIMAGIKVTDPLTYPNAIWYNYPPMWHNISCSGTKQLDKKEDNSKLTIQDQLELSTTMDHVNAIIINSFQEKLRSKLKLADDAVVTGSTRLVELGIDSLVAMDLRLWFRKVLDTDVSVLQLLGNSSINEIVVSIEQSLKRSLIPNVKGGS